MLFLSFFLFFYVFIFKHNKKHTCVYLLGIIPRTVKHLFSAVTRLADRGWTSSVTASFLEIYNETIRDLLIDDAGTQTPRYDIKQNKDGVMYVTNLVQRVVSDEKEVKKTKFKNSK